MAPLFDILDEASALFIRGHYAAAIPLLETAANALLQNRREPVALFIVPAGADEAFEASLQDMIATRPEMGTWIWRIAEGDMPALP